MKKKNRSADAGSSLLWGCSLEPLGTVRNPSSEKPDARNYGKGGKGGPRMGGRGRGRGNALQRM